MSFKSPGPEQMGHRKDTGNMHIQESSLLEREEEEGNSFDVPKKGGGGLQEPEIFEHRGKGLREAARPLSVEPGPGGGL